MKTIKIVVLAVITVVMASCGSTKQVAQQQDALEQQKQELALEEQRLMIEQRKAEMKVEHEIKMAELQRKKEMANKVIAEFCKEEALDGPGYLSGLGIAENQIDQRTARSVALKSAKAEIMNKFIGAFSSGLTEYTNNTNVPSGSKREMGKIEGGVKSAGQNAINKYSKIVCTQPLSNDLGGFDYHIVVHVSTEEVKKEIATRMESLEVDFKAEEFFKGLDNSLEAQKQYENEQVQKMQ